MKDYQKVSLYRSTVLFLCSKGAQTTLIDSEIEVIFRKYAGSSSKPNEDSNIISLEKFSNFLMSNDNTPFSEQDKPIWQDMTAPISEYYISSSHNTYLVGHQLVGVSTIEGYIRALLHSCRSVECEYLKNHVIVLTNEGSLVDIYDGDNEPVVYHGKTLTSKVSLRDICNAIAKYAFVTSPYAVLISAEIHCSVPQQDKIVDIMTEVFGDAIIQAPLGGRPTIKQLPSPDELKHKFLLKARQILAPSVRPTDHVQIGEKPVCHGTTSRVPGSETGNEGG